MRLSSYAVLSIVILASLVVNVPFAHSAPKDKGPAGAVVATFSGEEVNIQPRLSPEELAIFEYPEIRRISVNLLINFISNEQQWVDVLYGSESGGSIIFARFRVEDGGQQVQAVEFNAARWSLRAFNNSFVNTEPFSFEYQGTAIYSPSPSP